ncbi:putative HVA22-like protein g [Silene latifolia]|uniref:putative HVA22-like protein g n=1 Tax=Silene latifolia TaxID=37657 RepID=UPI003D78933F
MIGSFLTRGLVMILGYAYPAYECYKTLERNKPEIEQLRFWCQYWILIAVMTVFERIGDTFVSWVPMYSEAKLAFIIYLWYPKTKGTTFVYDSFFQPYVSKHETEIDRNLLELRSRAGDTASMYCQRAVSFGQTRIFEILQYVATQSTPRPQPTQAEQHAPAARHVPATVVASPDAPPPLQPPTRALQPPPQVEEPLSPTSSTSSSPQEDEQSSTEGSSTMGLAPPLPAPSPLKKSISMPDAPPSPRRPASNKAETMQIATILAKTDKPLIASQETVMEETIRITRGRLRKTRSTDAK